MNEIGSVEFGNWLINELMKETLLAKPSAQMAIKRTSARLASLKGAEKLLLEFLRHQEAMMGRASN
jgi:hypothetical protein